jgi:hypothetical protein
MMLISETCLEIPILKNGRLHIKKMSQDELFKLLVKQAKEPFANEIFSHIKDKDILENSGTWASGLSQLPKKLQVKRTNR